MRSFPRTSATGSPRAASHHNLGTVSPAALRIAQEADATMSPDGWEANYYEPGTLDVVPTADPASSPAGALPTA